MRRQLWILVTPLGGTMETGSRSALRPVSPLRLAKPRLDSAMVDGIGCQRVRGALPSCSK